LRRELHIAIVAVASFATASVAAAQAELDDPALEEPAVEEPAIEEPALDEPALDEPAAEEPALDEPAFDQAAEALSTPAPGTPQEEAAFGGAASFLRQDDAPWILDDGVGVAELPWDPYDSEIGYVPRGAVHAGVQLRVAAVLGGGINVPDGPLFELSGFLDIRYRPTSPWRIRLAIAASFQSWHEQYLGAGTIVASSPFSLRTRALFLNVDLGRWVNVRVGGDIGLQWTPSGGDGRVDVAGGPTAEITVLLLDGALEVGFAGGMQLTAYNRTSREYSSLSYAPEAVLGVTAAYVIP